MKLTKIAGSCGRDDCPTIYATDHDTYIVQGYTVTGEPDLKLSKGESAVEVPVSLVREVARALGR